MHAWSVEETVQWVEGVLELPSTDSTVSAELRERFEEEDVDGTWMAALITKPKRLKKLLKEVLPMGDVDAAAAAERLLEASEQLRHHQASASASSPVPEARTPVSVRWGVLLATGGPERCASLQAVADEWQAGRWILDQEVLGQGGGGAVFSSSDSRHAPARVAIKFIHQDEPQKIAREAALYQRVAHEHICKLHEHHVSPDGLLCGMVLEFLNA
jgi:hypothetical protein